jgi:biuret amidohydrolase
MSKQIIRFALDPRKTAVIVIDMQNCFVEKSPFAAPAGMQVLERVNRVVAKYREHGSLIIFARHVVRKDHSNIGLLGDVLPPVKGGIIDEDRPTAALHTKLDVRVGDIVLAKPRFGAFLSTDLELILRSKAIDTVIIGGIATNVCCDTTARDASMRDFRVLFLRDGTATFDFPDVAGMGVVSAEDMQRAICTTLAFAFGEVLSCEEAIAKLDTGQTMLASTAA